MDPVAPKLPRVARLIVDATYPSAERDEIAADLAAEFRDRRVHGRVAASLWLWRQLLESAPALVRRGLWRGWSGFESGANAMRPGGAPFESLVLDLRFTVRRLAARPLYALLAVATLALGVGGVSAIYGITRAFLINPLPFAAEASLGVFSHPFDWSEEELVYVRGNVPGFAAVAGYRHNDGILQQDDGPAQLVHGVVGTAELFDVLGTLPFLGRTFAAGDDAIGAAPVAVISHQFWQELGADPGIVGRRLMLDGMSRTIVGVMPAAFWFPEPSTQYWVAGPIDPEDRAGNYALIGRVASGASVDRSLEGFSALLRERFTGANWPGWLGEPLQLTPIRAFFFGALRPALVATLVAMGFILLMACANVAALMLGQIEGRTTELAVRAALGADRGRLARQILVESLVLGAFAAVLGAGVAVLTFRILVTELPLGALAPNATLDLSAFAAVLVIAVAAAMLVATLPVFSLWRGHLQGAIAHSRTEGIGGTSRAASTLAIGEVALAMLMASSAGLLVRSVGKLYAIDPGLSRDSVAVVDVVTPAELSTDERKRLVTSLVRSVAAVPGVTSASVVQRLPLRGRGWTSGLVIPEHPEIGRVATSIRMVGDGYFSTIGIPILAGRGVNSSDIAGREPAVVINAALAHKYFGGADPIGRQISTSFGPMGRVVGVVGNAAETDLTDEMGPVRYVAAVQMSFMVPAQVIVARTRARDAELSLTAIRTAIHGEAPAVAIQQATTLSAVIDRAVGPVRQIMFLLSLLTSLGLVLGAIGVYGVISQFATRRRREWGIRIALGLAPTRVVRHIVGRGARLVMIGIVVGATGMLLIPPFIAPFLYGVTAADPLSALSAIGVLAGVGVMAALVPAIRAGRVDPARVLRDQ